LTITIASSCGGAVGARNSFTVLRKIETPAIFRFVDSILAGRAIELCNFGHLRRDFTFVEDIVEGIVCVLALPPRGGSAQGRGSQAPMRLCNIGNQQPVELLHVVRTIERCLGRSADIRLMPMQQGDVYETHACVDKLREVTGYCPRFSIEEGIQKFVHWYLSEYVPLGLAGPPLFPLPVPLGVQGAYQELSAPVLDGWGELAG
jgi:nucleoside-diphosphate-sugar epimerase